MYIYAAEKEIEDKILNNNSIAYTTAIHKSGHFKAIDNLPFIKESPEFSDVISASIKDQELYYHTSILVTTNWNKNDDIFLPPVVWAAKDTPVHKPTNLGHDSTKIIGHMTASWPIDTDGKVIESKDEIVELPSKFHILVGSVIYKVWPSSDEYEKNVAELINQIEAGDKYVSMECGFKNFDYALKNDKETKIIARNDDTAFLSKHLRAYGGEGVWKDYKIGRVVREISFCGKGYVDKPANPESIIFTKDEISDFSSAKYEEKIIISQESGVISKDDEILLREKSIMSDFYKEQVDELKTVKAALEKSVDELKEKLAQSNISKLEKQIEELTAQTNDMSDVLKKKSDEVTSKDKEVADLTAKVAELTKSSDELTKTNKELTDKVNVIEAEKKIADRVSTLVAGGLTKEEADDKVKVFANLDDNQFKSLAETLIEAKKYVKPSDKKEDKKENKENPEDVKAEDLENTEITDKDVTSASVTNGDFDISELAGKIAAELKTKDGDK